MQTRAIRSSPTTEVDMWVKEIPENQVGNQRLEEEIGQEIQGEAEGLTIDSLEEAKEEAHCECPAAPRACETSQPEILRETKLSKRHKRLSCLLPALQNRVLLEANILGPCIRAAKRVAKHAGRHKIVTNDGGGRRTRRRNLTSSAAARATCESGRSPGAIDESRSLFASSIGGSDCRGSHPIAGCCESKFCEFSARPTSGDCL